jgi:hypothetical protein
MREPQPLTTLWAFTAYYRDSFTSTYTVNLFHSLKEILIYIIILSWMRVSPLGTAATTGLLYNSQITDDGDCEAIGGMKIGRRNLSTRRKSATT